MPSLSPVGVSLPARYAPEGFIAAGGMAGVWGARDTVLDRPVAIKVLAEHLSVDQDAKRRFQREARMAASVSDHPHVVTIFDVGEHEGRAFIVMEWLRGGSLADHLQRRGAPDRATALGWLREAASALDHAHERGLVHRDIKPGNFLLDEHNRLAVGDFGIARLVDSEGITQPGVVLGTAAYLSPEQALGEPATPASDRYSLAVVAFELLTGRKPFAADNFAAQARQQVEDDPPPASSLAPGLPRAVDGVLARGMAKDPGARWDSCTAFVEALEPALHDREATASATAATRVAEPLRRRAAATAGPPPVMVDQRRRSRGLLLVPFLLVLALLAGLVALLAGGDGGDGTASDRTPTTARDTGREREDRSSSSSGSRAPASTEEAEPGAGAAATAEPTQEQPDAERPAAGRGDGDPNALNAQGFERLQQGDYGGALPLLQRAVEECGDSDALDPCGYAYFNLGQTLNRLGRPDEAIPFLQTRLDRWGYDQAKTVRKELKSAEKAAGR